MTTHMKDYNLLFLDEFFFCTRSVCACAVRRFASPRRRRSCKVLWSGVGILNEGRKETWNEGTFCF